MDPRTPYYIARMDVHRVTDVVRDWAAEHAIREWPDGRTPSDVMVCIYRKSQGGTVTFPECLDCFEKDGPFIVTFGEMPGHAYFRDTWKAMAKQVVADAKAKAEPATLNQMVS